MLPTSVIIILREVLEAALLISMLGAISHGLGQPRRWTGPGILLGLLGAVVYSLVIDTVSGWFGGVGQEVVSATLQALIYLLLLVIMIQVLQGARHPGRRRRTWLPGLMALSVALAITREGFEIIVYLHGFTAVFSQFLTVSMGAVIGAGIGISTGVLLYYVLCHPVIQRKPLIGFGLLTLFGAGLLSQATLLMIQADWLPSQLPLWNTSTLLPENSISGQLLYVLIGYEATPSAIQVGVHVFGLLALLAVSLLVSRAGAFPSNKGHSS